MESSIREAVQSGQFPSVDDAMAEAARLLLSQLKQRPVARIHRRRGAARHRS